MIEHVYLDTMTWSFLLEDEAGAACLQALAAQRDKIQVIGSLPLLEELSALAPNQPRLFVERRNLVVDLVGRNWLKPLNERHLDECRVRSVIGDEGRYANRELRRQMARATTDAALMIELARQTGEQVERFQQDEEARRAAMRTKIAGDDLGALRAAVAEWWEDVAIESWVVGALDAGIDKGLVLPREDCAAGTFAETPSAWLLTAYRLSRLTATLGNGQRIDRGDYCDAEHVAAGAYYDTLVSADRRLRETCDRIQRKTQALPFKIEHPRTFSTRIQSL